MTSTSINGLSLHENAQDVARRSGSNFYLSFFSLPKEKREAMTAVYAFCRKVDDAVDAPGQADPQTIVDAWRAEIDRIYSGAPSGKLTEDLARSIDRFGLSRMYFEGILDGVAMDLRKTRYATFKELEEYCYHVAGEVGLLCMEIFGYRSERLKSYAVKLGNAFQLTNILRDIGTDFQQGRIYLPQEDMVRFGVTEERLAAWVDPRRAGGRPPIAAQGPRGGLSWEGSEGWRAFQNLMLFETQRARDFYRAASVLPTQEERPDLVAAEIMSAVYSSLLGRMESAQYNVFRRRIRVPKAAKLYLAAKTWWSLR